MKKEKVIKAHKWKCSLPLIILLHKRWIKMQEVSYNITCLKFTLAVLR